MRRKNSKMRSFLGQTKSKKRKASRKTRNKKRKNTKNTKKQYKKRSRPGLPRSQRGGVDNEETRKKFLDNFSSRLKSIDSSKLSSIDSEANKQWFFSKMSEELKDMLSEIEYNDTGKMKGLEDMADKLFKLIDQRGAEGLVEGFNKGKHIDPREAEGLVEGLNQATNQDVNESLNASILIPVFEAGAWAGVISLVVVIIVRFVASL